MRSPPASESRPRPRSKPCRCSSGPARSFPWGRSCSIPTRSPPIPIELRIYAGANGSFTLYEDEGDSYRYEKGRMRRFTLPGMTPTKTLTIGPRKGDFPGMLKERTFHVVWVSAKHGAGIGTVDQPDAVINYIGEAVRVVGRRD